MKPEKLFEKVYSDYDRYLVVPAAIFVLAAAVMGFSYIDNGEFFDKGIDFTGGTEITYEVEGDFTTNVVEQALASQGRPESNALRVEGERTLLLVRIPPPEIDSTQQAEQLLSEERLGDRGYNVTVEGFNPISASVSGQFLQQARLAVLLAFSVMSIVIFIAFRDLIPSLAVIFAATGDILVASAGMYLLGIPLTLGSLAALLMLIGYSVDTDIVLSSRVLKRKRKPMKERVWSSVKTGVTMSSGGIAGFALLYLVSYFYVGPSELSNIAAVMVIGLLADMPLTWFGNAIILKKYVEGDYDGLFERWNPWS